MGRLPFWAVAMMEGREWRCSFPEKWRGKQEKQGEADSSSTRVERERKKTPGAIARVVNERESGGWVVAEERDHGS